MLNPPPHPISRPQEIRDRHALASDLLVGVNEGSGELGGAGAGDLGGNVHEECRGACTCRGDMPQLRVKTVSPPTHTCHLPPAADPLPSPSLVPPTPCQGQPADPLPPCPPPPLSLVPPAPCQGQSADAGRGVRGSEGRGC